MRKARLMAYLLSESMIQGEFSFIIYSSYAVNLEAKYMAEQDKKFAVNRESFAFPFLLEWRRQFMLSLSSYSPQPIPPAHTLLLQSLLQMEKPP
jgi:hypothetical protein